MVLSPGRWPVTPIPRAGAEPSTERSAEVDDMPEASGSHGDLVGKLPTKECILWKFRNGEFGKHGDITHIMGDHGTSLEPIDLTPQYIHHGPHEWAINCW